MFNQLKNLFMFYELATSGKVKCDHVKQWQAWDWFGGKYVSVLKGIEKKSSKVYNFVLFLNVIKVLLYPFLSETYGRSA